jgi:hypothetical protein
MSLSYHPLSRGCVRPRRSGAPRACSIDLAGSAHWSSAIFNTVGSLHEGNLVFTVKVVELDGC